MSMHFRSGPAFGLSAEVKSKVGGLFENYFSILNLNCMYFFGGSPQAGPSEVTWRYQLLGQVGIGGTRTFSVGAEVFG